MVFIIYKLTKNQKKKNSSKLFTKQMKKFFIKKNAKLKLFNNKITFII